MSSSPLAPTVLPPALIIGRGNRIDFVGRLKAGGDGKERDQVGEEEAWRKKVKNHS